MELLGGRPLDRFFAAEIFRPLGMGDSWLRLPPASDRRGDAENIFSGEADDDVANLRADPALLDRVAPNYMAHRSGRGLHDIS